MGDWVPLAAGAAMLLVGAAMWAWAQVILGRAEDEYQRAVQQRLAALREMRELIAGWERRQEEGLGC